MDRCSIVAAVTIQEKKFEVRLYNSNEIKSPFGEKREKKIYGIYFAVRCLIKRTKYASRVGNWFLSRMLLLKNNITGLKMIAKPLLRVILKSISKFKQRFKSETEIDWFCFLISIEVTENDSRWLVYLFFKDDRVPSHNWVQSLKRVCLVFHHCVFYKFVTEAGWHPF